MLAGCGSIRLSTQTTVSGPPGSLVSINVGVGAASAVVNVYDGIANTDRLVAKVDGATKGSFFYGGIVCNKGIFVEQTGGNSDVTVAFL